MRAGHGEAAWAARNDKRAGVRFENEARAAI